jgi:hypothetical protein
MCLKMRLYTASFLVFLATAHAQSLSSLLGKPKGGFTDINTILDRYPSISRMLSELRGITILVPADGAKGLKLLLAETAPRVKGIVNVLAPNSVDSTLKYRMWSTRAQERQF